MAVYLLRRLVGLVVVLLAMTFIVFCLQSVVPGAPARAIAGPAAPAELVPDWTPGRFERPKSDSTLWIAAMIEKPRGPRL